MIVVDLETTGLLKPGKDCYSQPGIVQFGAQLLNSDYASSDWVSKYINPEMAIEEDAVATHGISQGFVAGAPTFPEIFPELVQIFRKSRTWVGFNIQFDKQVLKYNLERYGLDMRFPWPDKELDIMLITKDIIAFDGKRGPKPPNLTELHVALFGKPFDGAHDAMADVNATVDCMKELVRQGLI